MPEVMKTVGRYELLREVGRGGMALVYLARQTDLDRFVALKELGAFHASDPSFAQRFLRESRVAGSLSHPNIVTVHDYFEHDGTPYIAMEYIERGSLRPYVGRMNLAQIGGVLEGLLAGLTHGESHGHRPPRPQAREPDGHRRRAREDRRLRHRQGDHEDADGRVPDRDRHDRGHADLHGARAGDGAGHRRLDRPLLGRLHGLRDVHGQRPVPRLRRADGDPAAPRQRADRAGQVSIRPEVDPRISDWIEALLVKEPTQRTQNAKDAWDDFEEILLSLLGPRWRREARLVERERGRRQRRQAADARPVPGHERRRRRLRGVQVLRLGRARVGHRPRGRAADVHAAAVGVDAVDSRRGRRPADADALAGRPGAAARPTPSRSPRRASSPSARPRRRRRRTR